jgi:hypothetical protein
MKTGWIGINCFRLAAATFMAALLSACTTVNSDTVNNMPPGELCFFLDLNTWILSDSERQAIYAELKARNKDCVLATGAAVDA